MKRENRLKKRSAFAYVYRKGEKTSLEDLSLYKAKSKEGLKIGLTVTKKIGNAVTRNHVKRMLREAILPIQDQIDPGFMYVIVVYQSIVDKGLAEIKESILDAFSKSGALNA